MTHRLPLFVMLSLMLHGMALTMLAGGAREHPGRLPGLQWLPVSLEQPASAGRREPIAAADRLRTQPSTIAAPAISSASTENPATAAPSTTASARPQIEAAGQQLQQALHRALLPHFYYPLLARAQGWQGEALFAVHVAADGHLSRLQLTRSSGYAVLDRAALDSLGKIHELPETRRYEIGAQGMTLRIPVVYKLTEG